MATFDLKKFIAENKATFHSSLNEGEETTSSKMTKEELKAKIKEMVLSEMGNTKDFASTPTERPDGTFDISGTMKELDINEEEETETEEEVEVNVKDSEPMEEPTGDGGISVNQNADADLTGIEKEVQDNLEAAMEAAKKLNDEKLQQQIGNSLTFFTRQHVVKEEMTDESLNEELLSGLADYKVAFDIATDIGVSAALVGFGIYKLGIKKTIELLKKGAKEFKEIIKWAMNK